MILDFDDTFFTVFGSKEGSANGYNPRYKGRPSFKKKVGIISKTNELLNLTLKEGFAFDQNTQINRKCNELYLLIKMIAFNLNNWFKRTFLPESMHHHEITTIRRIFYKIAGNICGSGWYKHIRFAPNKLLKKTITHLRKALTDFRKKVVIN